MYEVFWRKGEALAFDARLAVSTKVRHFNAHIDRARGEFKLLLAHLHRIVVREDAKIAPFYFAWRHRSIRQWTVRSRNIHCPAEVRLGSVKRNII